LKPNVLLVLELNYITTNKQNILLKNQNIFLHTTKTITHVYNKNREKINKEFRNITITKSIDERIANFLTKILQTQKKYENILAHTYANFLFHVIYNAIIMETTEG